MAFDSVLFALYSLNFFINAANSVLAPFYPNEAISKGLSTGLIGVVFSTHPICSFFFSLILGKMMKSWGRKRILSISLLLQAIGLMLFGSVIHFNDYSLFVFISVLARGIQGFGLGAYGSIAFAYLPLLYPKSVAKKVAFMELLTGLGLMLGPLLGGLLFELGGYQCPFYVMSAIFIVATPFILKKLPNDKQFHQDEKKKPLHLSKFFKDRKILFLYVLLILPNCGISFLEPTLAHHLSNYTSNQLVIAFLFSVGTITYALTIPLITLMHKDYNKKTILIFGTLICSISYIFIGPSESIGLPPRLWLTIVGLSLMGIGCALTLVPSIPEFINIGSEIYPDEKEGVGDMAAGLYNSAYSAGILIGPLVGGALDEKIGFGNAEGVYSVMSFGILMLYVAFGDGYLGLIARGKDKKGELLLDSDDSLKETEDPVENESNINKV